MMYSITASTTIFKETVKSETSSRSANRESSRGIEASTFSAILNRREAFFIIILVANGTPIPRKVTGDLTDNVKLDHL